jgi:hypothetical protein
MTLLQIYQVVISIWAFGVFVSTLEFLAITPSFAPTGMYAWGIARLRLSRRFPSPSRAVLDKILDLPGLRVLLIFRLALIGALMLVPIASSAFSVIIWSLVVQNLAFTWRRVMGDDGSDQMSAVILLTAAICVGPQSSPQLLKIGLWYLTAQCCLAYTAAGLAKLVSPVWRRSQAIPAILSTQSYGLPTISRFLESRRPLSLILTWTVIIAESTFLLVLVIPWPWNLVFLIWGVAFHLSTAIIMGLNSFLWTFLATYPAVIYTATHLRI